jgi:hypothetical protein
MAKASKKAAAPVVKKATAKAKKTEISEKKTGGIAQLDSQLENGKNHLAMRKTVGPNNWDLLSENYVKEVIKGVQNGTIESSVPDDELEAYVRKGLGLTS